MPTRLLDFSKSFLIATLFACVDWAYCNNKDNMDGVIYSLSTQNFKRKTKASEYKQLFFHNNENEDFYYLDTRGNESNDVRKRIKKQKGCFIFFNNIRYSVLSDSFIRHKIIIKADLKQKLIKWLKNNKQICLINIT